MLLGYNPSQTYYLFKGLPFFIKDFWRIKKQKGLNTDFKFSELSPMLRERNDVSGIMTGHYFHQDLLIARKIFRNNPIIHLDIGSRTDGFVTHVASFRQIEIIDIRDQIKSVENIIFRQADLMRLPKNMINYCDSISSLHAIEHFGLGRYGDPVDYYGHVKAIENIYKILKANGIFYFSVPIGEQKIVFNSHRIFSIEYLMGIFENKFEIMSFSYVDDKGDLIENAEMTTEQIRSNFNCRYGCGIFELKKYG